MNQKPVWRNFARELALACAVCLILIALVVFTSGSAPQWIYQGF